MDRGGRRPVTKLRRLEDRNLLFATLPRTAEWNKHRLTWIDAVDVAKLRIRFGNLLNGHFGAQVPHGQFFDRIPPPDRECDSISGCARAVSRPRGSARRWRFRCLRWFDRDARGRALVGRRGRGETCRL